MFQCSVAIAKDIGATTHREMPYYQIISVKKKMEETLCKWNLIGHSIYKSREVKALAENGVDGGWLNDAFYL